MTERTHEQAKAIHDAMDARPKLKIVLAEGRNEAGAMVPLHRWKVGDIVSLSKRQREYAIAQGWAVAVGRESKEAKDDKKDK